MKIGVCFFGIIAGNSVNINVSGHCSATLNPTLENKISKTGLTIKI